MIIKQEVRSAFAPREQELGSLNSLSRHGPFYCMDRLGEVCLGALSRSCHAICGYLIVIASVVVLALSSYSPRRSRCGLRFRSISDGFLNENSPHFLLCLKRLFHAKVMKLMKL